MKNAVQDFPDLVIYVHVFKGINGHLLAKDYVCVFLGLLSNFMGKVKIYWLCYGFNRKEQPDIELILTALKKNNCFNEVAFYPSVGSELPTLRAAVTHCKNLHPSSLVLYLHSKGASYKEQESFRNWSIYCVSALAAATDSISEKSEFFDEFDAIGSFASAGVFERYGIMTIAYSGNFWLTTAGFLASKSAGSFWYSDLFHNRHYAESLIGLNSSPSRLFNLEENYNNFSLKRHDALKIYQKKKYEIQQFLKNDIGLTTDVKIYIDSYYENICSQQRVYSQRRAFWGLRKLFFGNKSFLRRSNIISMMLDKLDPYCNCELYRHQSGPTHFDVSQKLLNPPLGEVR